MKEFIPCEKCKGSKLVPIGFYKTIEIRNGIEYKVLKECDHHIEWRNEFTLFKSLKNMGLKEDQLKYNLSDYIGDKENINRLENYVKNFSNESVKASILYFFGPPDTQKTTVAISLIKLLFNYDIKYIHFQKFIDDYISSLWDNDNNNIDYYEECDLLIIDNFSDKDLSEKQLNLFEKFVQKRLSNNKGFIFISNLTISQLKNNNLKFILSKETKKRNSSFIFSDVVNNIPEILF